MSPTPPRRRRRVRQLLALALLLGAYPTFVLGSVYSHWLAAGLPGGRHGPADAYRHALASATVAYTGSPQWVEWTTFVMEERGETSTAARAMDAHNNRVGARIGANASSWDAMQADVLAAVQRGREGTASPDQITWLPRATWRERPY